jgi:hypothetical protein
MGLRKKTTRKVIKKTPEAPKTPKAPIAYKNGKVEIKGNADEVSKHITYQQIEGSLKWFAMIVFMIILLSTLPEASWLPLVMQWLKKQVMLLTLFVGVEIFLLLQLSG